MALGHPKGLFPLFFTEMWERLAFYTMLAVLLLYATDSERGGLGLTQAEGNEIYGLYLAFVYFTPFLGGMLADRYLGYRRSVFIGGVLMSSGLFLMGIPGFTFFVTGLVLLVCGNGFFKPNISVMVGNLYEPGDTKRDAGFNIFYMGINIGALAATLVFAPLVRNYLGWLATFWVAGAGLIIGLVILLSNWKALSAADRQPERDPDDTPMSSIFGKILAPAFTVGIVAAVLYGQLAPEGALRPAVVGFLAGMVPVIIFFVRMGLTARPEEKPGLLSLLPIYVAGGTFFMILHLNGSAMTQWARDTTDREGLMFAGMKQEALPNYYPNAPEDTLRPDRRSLLVVDDATHARMYGQQRLDENALTEIATATAGDIEIVEIQPKEGELSEIDEQLAARAVPVYEAGVVSVEETTDSHGAKTITVSVAEGAKPKKNVAFVRQVDGKPVATFLVSATLYQQIYDGYVERFGHEPKVLPPGEYLRVINSEIYQSYNPFFVIFFTPLVVFFFGWMVRKKRPITTARKVFLGLCLTTVSLLFMAVAGFLSDGGATKVSSMWLASFYGMVTLGELCLSPMGLSLVTKLTPKRLVGLAMGGWFMATAFGNNFSGFFGGIQGLMEPMWFFLLLAGLAALSATFIFLLLPKLDAAIKKYGA